MYSVLCMIYYLFLFAIYPLFVVRASFPFMIYPRLFIIYYLFRRDSLIALPYVFVLLSPLFVLLSSPNMYDWCCVVSYLCVLFSLISYVLFIISLLSLLSYVWCIMILSSLLWDVPYCFLFVPSYLFFIVYSLFFTILY